MRLQLHLDLEEFVAALAHVRLLLLVDLLHVVLEVGQLREGYFVLAQLTAKWFLAGMLADVEL